MTIEINPESISLTALRAQLFIRESMLDKDVIICVISSSDKNATHRFEEKIKHMVTQIHFNEVMGTAIYFKKPEYSKDEMNKLSIEFIESLIHENTKANQNRQAAYC